MAIVRAVKSGVWSDPTVWNTGALPTSADDVYSNTFTVTIDISTTVLSISNAATTGVTAGGSFTLGNGVTLTVTGNITPVTVTPWTTLINTSLSAGQSGSIVAARIYGGNNNTQAGVAHGGAGTLNITADAYGGTYSASYGVANTGSGVINFTGTLYGANVGSSSQIGSAAGFNSGAGTFNLTGTTIGGSNAQATGTTLGAHGAVNNSSGTFTITGQIQGGGSFGCFGAVNASTGTLAHVGTASASSSCPAIGIGGVSQITTLTGPLISSDGSGGTAAASGVNPCTALRWFPADTALSTFEYRMRGATVSGSPSVRPARQLFLTNAYDATYPAAGNVRSATTYGPGSIYTGTCAVPPAGSVALGVPVDATTGTAAVTAATIRAAMGLASANLDTQLASAVPPTAAAIASAVWAAATRTLSTTIPQVSDIASAVWSAVSRTITGGSVDTLVNAPTVPTPTQIADQVRIELTPELDRLSNTATFEQVADIVENSHG